MNISMKEGLNCKFSRNLVPMFFVLSCVLSLSPVFNVIMDTRGNFIFIFFLLLSLLFLCGRKLDKKIFLLLSVFSCFPLMLSLYWEDVGYLTYSLYFLLSFLLVSYLKINDIHCIIHIFSNVLLVMLIGAFISFVYAFLGGDPIFEIINPDGRSGYLYFSSMTNWVLGRLIRPSGIFDEPGTLSFIVCFVCAARHLLGFDKKLTWFMLLLGFVTLSVAHAIYVFFHFFSERFKIKYISLVVVVFLCSLFLIYLNNNLYMLLDEHLLSRFTYVSGKGFVGDNRTVLLSNAISMLSFKSFIFGVDSSCISNVEVCDAKYQSFGENPLSLLILTGIALSFPYYIILVLFFLFGIQRRNDLVLFALALLLLQRPYVMSFGYSLLIMCLLSVGISSGKCFSTRERI